MIEEFTSYVKDVYLNEVLDKKIASSMKENFERRNLIILLYILLVVLWPLLCVGSLLLILPILNSLLPGILFIILWIAILLLALFWLIRFEAQFKDRQISEEKLYAKRFRETREAYEIPNVSHHQSAFDGKWRG